VRAERKWRWRQRCPWRESRVEGRRRSQRCKGWSKARGDGPRHGGGRLSRQPVSGRFFADRPSHAALSGSVGLQHHCVQSSARARINACAPLSPNSYYCCICSLTVVEQRPPVHTSPRAAASCSSAASAAAARSAAASACAASRCVMAALTASKRDTSSSSAACACVNQEPFKVGG
jgi:hypothetical protein